MLGLASKAPSSNSRNSSLQRCLCRPSVLVINFFHLAKRRVSRAPYYSIMRSCPARVILVALVLCSLVAQPDTSHCHCVEAAQALHFRFLQTIVQHHPTVFQLRRRSLSFRRFRLLPKRGYSFVQAECGVSACAAALCFCNQVRCLGVITSWPIERQQTIGSWKKDRAGYAHVFGNFTIASGKASIAQW